MLPLCLALMAASLNSLCLDNTACLSSGWRKGRQSRSDLKIKIHTCQIDTVVLNTRAQDSMCLPECCVLEYPGVRGEMAGVPGETAAVGFWGGVKWSGLALGGGASFSGFWLVGGEEILSGWGGSRCWTGWCSSSEFGTLLCFPPVATGGGISSSLMGFPLLADVNMDCRVCHRNY